MSFAQVAALADNPLRYVDGQRFAAILGAAPSHGARSPHLWNAAFRTHGLEAEMLPMDVPDQRLPLLLTALERNPCFLGGAIAIPHKEAVARWLGDRVVAEARAVGAVNCLFRNQHGHLEGSNTDGEGALAAFEERFGKAEGKRVLVLGLGGAGKAVAAYFRRIAATGGKLTLCSRSSSASRLAKVMNVAAITWNELTNVLPATDILINCTSVGTGAQSGLSPLPPEQVMQLPEHAKVYDINYHPRPTALLDIASARGLATLDGATMNLEQAVLAYSRAAPEPRGRTATRRAMQESLKTIR